MNQQSHRAAAPRWGSPLHAAVAPLLADVPAPSDGELLAELSKVMGVTDAIALHGLLRGGARAMSRPLDRPADDGASVQATVLAARQSQRDFVVNSFAPEPNQAPFCLPSLDEPPGYDGLTGPQRLQRFYSRHQQEMEVRAQTLRGQVRQAVAQFSPALARLAELDDKVGQVVTAQLARALAVIPGHLSRHCKREAEAGTDHWQAAVTRLTQTLLLAELDVRLEPVFGLVEAVEEWRVDGSNSATG